MADEAVREVDQFLLAPFASRDQVTGGYDGHSSLLASLAPATSASSLAQAS